MYYCRRHIHISFNAMHGIPHFWGDVGRTEHVIPKKHYI